MSLFRANPGFSRAVRGSALSSNFHDHRLYQAVFEAYPQAVALINNQNIIINSNRPMLHLLGLKGEASLNGQDVFSLISPGYHGAFTYHQEIMLENGQAQNLLCKAVRPDGSELEVRISCSPVIGDSENNRHFICIFEDLSEESALYKQLRESEHKYHLIFDQAPLGLFHFDEQGLITECNDQFINVIGSTGDLLVGFDLKTVKNPDMLVQIEGVLRGEPGYYEGDYESLTGGKVALTRVIFDPIINEEGRIEGGVGIVEDITMQRDATRRLARREAQLRLITDNMLDSVIQLDLEGNVLYATPSHEQMTGWNNTNRQSANLFTYIHPSDRLRIILEFRSFIKRREATVVAFRCLHADGHYMWMECSVSFISDEENGTGWIIASVRDISERKQAELALRASEERYRNILESIEDAYFEVDLQGNLRFYNDAMVRLQGYPEDEMLGLGYRTYSDAETAQRLYEVFHRVYKTGIPVKGFEWDIRDKGGNIRRVDSSVSPITDVYGNISGFRGILRDVTDYQQAREALRQSEARFRFLAHNMADIVNQLNADGYIQYVSPSSKNVLGYEPEELMGTHFMQKVHPEDKESVLKAAYRAARERTSGRAEYRYLHANGRYIWMEIVGKPIYGEDGNLLGGIFSSRDIGDRKYIEEQLRHVSLHDSLTGLYNRAYFEQEMQRLESGRHDPVGMIICDVDGLKIINDKLGHAEGDSLLKAIARLLSGNFRDSDVVARIGGDEFAILMPACSEEILASAVDRLSRRIKAYNSSHSDTMVGLSAGAALRSDRWQKMSDLYKEADNRMYVQKVSSRRRYWELLCAMGLIEK